MHSNIPGLSERHETEVQLSREDWWQQTKVQVQRSNLGERTESKQIDVVPNSKGQVINEDM